MKRTLVAAVVVVAAIVVVTWYGKTRTTAVPLVSAAPQPTAASGSASPPPADRGAPPTRRSHLTRLASPEERRQLADQIAAAQAARAAHPRPVAPSLPHGPNDAATPIELEHVSVHLKDALEEAIPLLAECYQQVGSAQASKRPAVQMTLVGDPSIGTLIDADQMFDEAQQPLSPALDACLRTTLESLALPPLDEGDTLKIQYSFKFD